MPRKLTQEQAFSIAESVGLRPLEPYAGTSKPWKCEHLACGRVIFPRLDSIKARNTASCASCGNKETQRKQLGDASVAIAIMKSYGLEPLVEYPGTNRPWSSKHIACQSIISPKLSTVKRHKSPCCKACGNKETQRKQLGDEKEAVAFMLSKGLKPLIKYPGRNRPWKSECLKCGRSVQPHLGSVKGGRGGCAYCAGRKVDENNAVALMIASNLQPLVPYPGGKTNWKCLCIKCGKIVFPNYSDIQSGDGGCKYCGGKFVEPQFAVDSMIASGLRPLVPYRNATAKWHCICEKCGKDVYPMFATIQAGHGGCKYCAGIFVDAQDAEAVMRAHNLEPLVPYPGSKKPWRCKCLKCGKIVAPTHGSLKAGNGSCAYCSRKVVDPDDAIIFMRANGLEPLEPYKRADGPWKCRCMKCGRNVRPSYSAIGTGQGGCKYCAIRGIDYTLPAHVYLMTHPIHRAHKIGIANDKTKNNRVGQHKRDGWTLFRTLDFESAVQAEAVEKAVLDWLKLEMHLSYYLSQLEMPRGGFTETVDASEIDLPTIWQKVEEFAGHHGGTRERKRMKNGEK